MVPSQGRQEILHEGHPGISRRKSFTRGIVWWPQLDADQENLVRSCKACQENQKCLLHGSDLQSLGLGHKLISLAPFGEDKFFTIVDAHSKWVDVFVVSSPSSQQAIRDLDKCFHHKSWFLTMEQHLQVRSFKHLLLKMHSRMSDAHLSSS